MPDGKTASLSIISISNNNNKQYDQYLLQINVQKQSYYIYTRYSQLRRHFKNINKDVCQFPSRCYIQTLIKPLMKDSSKAQFRKNRLQQLKNYFKQLSNSVNLTNIPQFNMLLQQAINTQDYAIIKKQRQNIRIKPRSLSDELLNVQQSVQYVSA